MPFLRAALMPNKKPEKIRAKPKMVVRSLCDLEVANAVKMWIHEDDISTARELALLGL